MTKNANTVSNDIKIRKAETKICGRKDGMDI